MVTRVVHSEINRKRRYNEKWEFDDNNKRREWLEYDSEKDGMFYEDCRCYSTTDAQRKGTYVTGMLKFKIEAVKEHESLRHVGSASVYLTLENVETNTETQED